MFHYYSLFFLNGRADKNLRTDSGAILAVIAGYCRSAKTELLRIESMRIVVVTGKEELLHRRHEAISGRLSSSRLQVWHQPQLLKDHLHSMHLSSEQRVILYCIEPRFTIQTFIAGVFDAFLIHQAAYQVDAKANGRRIRMQPGRVCFIIVRKKIHEWMATDS